jgi:RimJ/RimL family protein N-acetyltransferase
MIAFIPILECEAGSVASLLVRSYAELLADPHWRSEQEKFSRFDREVFENPFSIGRCAFATRLGEATIGFASYDPRQEPELGIVGHNCILPEFRGKGYGGEQTLEVLRRLRRITIRKAVVTTSEHPFFRSAQRMYLSCGFAEKRRVVGGLDPRYGVIEYELNLAD